jgi:hypothetical protein
LGDEGRHDATRNFLRGSKHQKSRTHLICGSPSLRGGWK